MKIKLILTVLAIVAMSAGAATLLADDDPNLSADLGNDIITWSGEPVLMDPNIINPDSLPLTYHWDADPCENPELEVLISDPSAQAPTITLTKLPKFVPFLRNGNVEYSERTTYLMNPGDARYFMPLEGEIWRALDNGNNGTAGRWMWPNGVERGWSKGGTSTGFDAAPEGDFCLYVYTRYDLTNSPANYSTPREFEAVCQMLQGVTFDPDVEITLSALVGRFPAAAYPYNGYKLQIAVGGEEVDTGGAFSIHIDGGIVIAEDDSTVTPAENAFELASVTYTPDPEVDLSEYAGMPIQVRLVALEGPDLTVTSAVAFDDVHASVDGIEGVYVVDPAMNTVTVTLDVIDGTNPDASGSMMIDVYATPCDAAIGAGADYPSDLNLDCNINLGDFGLLANNWVADEDLADLAAMAAEWLIDNYQLTEPVEKLDAVPVLDVVGSTQADAIDAIAASDFIVGIVKSGYSYTVPVGDVISQTPAAESSAIPGSRVSIVVSLGVEITAPNPDPMTFAVAPAPGGGATTGVGTMSASLTAPAVDGEDIANFGTVTGSDKWFSEDSAAGSAKGQTFTTVDAAVLNAITYQVTDTANADPNKTYTVRIGKVDGTFFTEIHSATFIQDFAWNSSEYMTWTFDTPVSLEAGVEYAIDIGMTDSTSSWQTGIPYLNLTADDYAGGVRYTSGTSGIGTDALGLVSNGDRIFHIDMSLPDGGDTVGNGDPSTEITMIAAEATDDAGVEYYFTCTAGGGNDSGWQDSRIYTDTGLTPATEYTYTVTARDKSTNQNETAPSTEESATTAATP